MKRYDVSVSFGGRTEALTDGNGPAESARILRKIADEIERGAHDIGGIHDANGNAIGSWRAGA